MAAISVFVATLALIGRLAIVMPCAEQFDVGWIEPWPAILDFDYVIGHQPVTAAAYLAERTAFALDLPHQPHPCGRAVEAVSVFRRSLQCLGRRANDFRGTLQSSQLTFQSEDDPSHQPLGAAPLLHTPVFA